MTIKKIYYFVLGIILTAIAKVVWRWEKAGLIGKSTAIILSLVCFIFGLASFYVSVPDSITRAADVDVILTNSSDNAMCYDLGSCYTVGINNRLGYRDGASYGDIYSGFRFQNIVIPQGATIDDAFFSVYAFTTDAWTVDVKVWAEATDDGATFNTTTRTPKTVTAGANSVAWTLPNSTADVQYTSPDIKTVIQEVINRGGWVSGNDLIILVRNNGDDNNRLVRSGYYADKEPSIAINYTVGGGAARRIIIVE